MRNRMVNPKAMLSHSAATPGSGYWRTGITGQGGTDRLERMRISPNNGALRLPLEEGVCPDSKVELFRSTLSGPSEAISRLPRKGTTVVAGRLISVIQMRLLQTDL